MSGTVKKVTDVAFKASKNIDWDGMAKLLVSDEARKEFANLRRAFNEVNSQLETKFSQVLASPNFPLPSSVYWRSSVACCISLLIGRSLAFPTGADYAFFLFLSVAIRFSVYYRCQRCGRHCSMRSDSKRNAVFSTWWTVPYLPVAHHVNLLLLKYGFGYIYLL